MIFRQQPKNKTQGKILKKNTLDTPEIIGVIKKRRFSLDQLKKLSQKKKLALIAVAIFVLGGVGLYVYRTRETIYNPLGAPIVEFEGKKYTADFLVTEDKTNYTKTTLTADEQIKAVQDKILSSGDDFESHITLAELYLAKKDNKQAIIHYEKAKLHISTTDPYYASTVASIDEFLKQLKEGQ